MSSIAPSARQSGRFDSHPVVLLRGMRYAGRRSACTGGNWKSSRWRWQNERPSRGSVEVRQNVLKQTTCGARAARALPRSRCIRREPGFEPRLRQNRVPREDADAAQPADYRVAALVGDLATDNDAARLARSQAPGEADHHRNGLPSGSRHGPRRARRDGISTSSTFCSSRTSAIWSARLPTTWAKICGWSCSRSPKAKTSRSSIRPSSTAPMSRWSPRWIWPTLSSSIGTPRWPTSRLCGRACAVIQVSAKTGEGMEEWLATLQTNGRSLRDHAASPKI